MSLLASTSFFWTGHQVGELAHDYVPALKQWASSKGIKNSYDSWHGMYYYMAILDGAKAYRQLILDPSFHYLSHFLCEGGKDVKKAIKKMASGLVRDAEKTWFAELSDKGNTALCRLPDDSLVP